MENQLDEIRADFKKEIVAMKSDFDTKNDKLRADFETKIVVAELRAEIAEIRKIIKHPKVFGLFFKFHKTLF